MSCPKLVDERDRWPAFVAAATEAGFAAIHVLPMRLRTVAIGAVSLFSVRPQPLGDTDRRIGQALADLAAVALLQSRALDEDHLLREQLRFTLDAEDLLEQAKGVLAEQHGISVEAAFNAMRRYASAHGLRLSDLARALATGAGRPSDFEAWINVDPSGPA